MSVLLARVVQRPFSRIILLRCVEVVEPSSQHPRTWKGSVWESRATGESRPMGNLLRWEWVPGLWESEGSPWQECMMECLFRMEQPSRFERDQLSCFILEDYGHRKTEVEQDPVGPSWAQKSFHVSHFLFEGKRLSASSTFQELQRAYSNSC